MNRTIYRKLTDQGFLFFERTALGWKIDLFSITIMGMHRFGKDRIARAYAVLTGTERTYTEAEMKGAFCAGLEFEKDRLSYPSTDKRHAGSCYSQFLKNLNTPKT